MMLAYNGIIPPKEWLYHDNKPIDTIDNVKKILKEKDVLTD